MPDESEGFVVRDRRRFLNDAEPAATPSAPTPPTPTAPSSPAIPEEDDSEDLPIDAAQFAALMNQMAAMQGMQGGMDDDDDMEAMQGMQGMQGGPGYPEGGDAEDATLPDIYSVLVMFLNEMRTHALLRLGLVANPVTGQSEQDLEQARVAIDTLGFLVSQLEPVIAPEERLPIRAMVSDLQMQFARQSQAG